MQGRSDPQRELLDVESLAGHLLPKGGVFAFLAEHHNDLFPEQMFAICSPRGEAARRCRSRWLRR